MSGIVNKVLSGVSSLVSVFKPSKKLTEEQAKLIPYRDFAQSLLQAKGISKREVSVEISHPFKADGIAITFVFKNPEHVGERVLKQRKATYETVIELSKCIPANPKTIFIIKEVGKGAIFYPTKVGVTNGDKLDFESLRG